MSHEQIAQLASLPMYDLAELSWATDALWAAIAHRLSAAGLAPPLVLTRAGAPAEHWAAEGLLFSQTCGYPLVHAFAGRLRVLATPRYRAPGCEGTSYASAIVVRGDDPAGGLEDLRGARCAVNDLASQSGMNVLRAMVAPLAHDGRFFREVRLSGAHVESIALVQRGEADVCAVDAVTHALLARARPDALRGTRVLMMSPRAPALPYVTRASADDALVAILRSALAGALASRETAEARAALLLEGAEIADASDYAPIARMAREAAALGLHDLG